MRSIEFYNVGSIFLSKRTYILDRNNEFRVQEGSLGVNLPREQVQKRPVVYQQAENVCPTENHMRGVTFLLGLCPASGIRQRSQVFRVRNFQPLTTLAHELQ